MPIGWRAPTNTHTVGVGTGAIAPLRRVITHPLLAMTVPSSRIITVSLDEETAAIVDAVEKNRSAWIRDAIHARVSDDGLTEQRLEAALRRERILRNSLDALVQTADGTSRRDAWAMLKHIVARLEELV